MSESPTWQDDVWRRHIALFDRATPFSTGMASLPDGWRDLIDTLLGRVGMVIAADRIASMTISRLRHAHGVLGLEWSAAALRLEPMVTELIDRATARAACTCAVCGEAGRRYIKVDQVEVSCDTHRLPGSDEIWPNFPLIRIEREIRECRSRIARCRLRPRERHL